MSDIEIPELWRTMTCSYDNNLYKKPYLPNNNLKMYRKKIYDIYATKDGYMKFTLDKRLEYKIIDKTNMMMLLKIIIILLKIKIFN